MGHTRFQSGWPGRLWKLEKLFPSLWHAGPLLPLQAIQTSSLCLKRALSQLTTNTEQFFPFDVSPQSSQQAFLLFRNSLSVAQESAVGLALPASSGLVSVDLERLPGSFVLPVTSVCTCECACACACVCVCVRVDACLYAHGLKGLTLGEVRKVERMAERARDLDMGSTLGSSLLTVEANHRPLLFSLANPAHSPSSRAPFPDSSATFPSPLRSSHAAFSSSLRSQLENHLLG